jgi:polyhydroxyalkanoate synthase
MYLADPNLILKEFSSATEKLAQTYRALQNVEQVALGSTEKELVCRKDKMNLHHYSADGTNHLDTPTLIVYALVNRHNMMDLQPDRSFIQNLQTFGVDLYLIDWGYPSAEDKFYTMEEYIDYYIDFAVDAIRDLTGQEKINIMGICQGGTFSIIYSSLYPQKVKNLITLVTPVDFQTPNDLLSKWARHLDVDALVDSNGVVAGEFLNKGFAMLKPMLNTNKHLALMKSSSNAQLLNFLRMEYWINDSPAQAGECFRQFIKELYQQNKLVKGIFQLGNKPVDLNNITMPLLNIYAQEDHLVPPESSLALDTLVASKDRTTLKFNGGHIGVFVGSRSQKELAPAIAKWLNERDHYV